jgi:hypothetical protein
MRPQEPKQPGSPPMGRPVSVDDGHADRLLAPFSSHIAFCRHDDDVPTQAQAGGRALETGIAEAEHPAVGRDQPVGDRRRHLGERV